MSLFVLSTCVCICAGEWIMIIDNMIVFEYILLCTTACKYIFFYLSIDTKIYRKNAKKLKFIAPFVLVGSYRLLQTIGNECECMVGSYDCQVKNVKKKIEQKNLKK